MQNQRERFLANLVSYLFHPLLMMTYAVVIYYTAFPYVRIVSNWKQTGIRVLLFFILTFVIPGLSTLLLVRSRRLRNMQLDERSDRMIPILYTAMMYLVVYFMLRNQQVPDFIKVFLLGTISALLLAGTINLKWKISLHTIGIGGLTGAILAAWFHIGRGDIRVLSLLFFLCGLVGFSRLVLGAHRPGEVYAGYLLGFLIQFVAIFFFAF